MFTTRFELEEENERSAEGCSSRLSAVGYVAYRAKKLGVNPYKHEVFVGTKDYEKAMARREDVAA